MIHTKPFYAYAFWQKPIAVWLIFILALILCISNIWGYPIFILDEAKNAQAASEMWTTGNWFSPSFNGSLRTDKPPLHYAAMSLFYNFFGANVFTARFGSALMGAASFALLFWFVRRWKGAKMALTSCLIIACSPLFVMEFHLAVPDPYFIFFTFLASVTFYSFSQTRKRYFLLLFYGATAFAVLAKGPVAIGLIGLSVLLFLGYKKELYWRKILSYYPLLGGLAVLLIAVPWFYIAHKATQGAFTEGFFLDHNLNRFGSEMEGHGGIFLLTWAFVLIGMLPFGFFLIGYSKKIVQQQWKDSFMAYALIVSVVWIGFFSISSTKLPNYTMPCYPFLAVLLSHVFFNAQFKTKKAVFYFLTGITFLLPFAVAIAFHFGEPQLKHHLWVGVFFIPAFIGSLWALYRHQHKVVMDSFLSLAIGWVVSILLLFFLAVPRLAKESPAALSYKKFANKSVRAVYKSYDPALLFAFGTPFKELKSEPELDTFFRQMPNGIVFSKTKNFPNKQVPVKYRVVLRQKALFENYEMVAIQLK